jgi:hypothetical protein
MKKFCGVREREEQAVRRWGGGDKGPTGVDSGGVKKDPVHRDKIFAVFVDSQGAEPDIRTLRGSM